MKKIVPLAALTATLALVPSASAQVTSGATEVTTAADAEKAAERADKVEDTSELSLQAGALVAGGNSRTTAATAGGRFLLRRGPHEVTDAAAFNYARSANADTGVMETTVENYQNRLRYDYFFTKRFSAFLAWQMRRDEFQGLDLRMGVDPGLAYYFVRNDNSKFWGEGGYDFQYEVRSDETIEAAFATDGTVVEKTEVDHNLRLYLGYDQRLDDRLHLVAGTEFYKSFIHKNAWRFNWEAQLKMGIVENFSLAIGSLAQFDNAPLPGVRKLDVVSSLSFVYTFL